MSDYIVSLGYIIGLTTMHRTPFFHLQYPYRLICYLREKALILSNENCVCSDDVDERRSPRSFYFVTCLLFFLLQMEVPCPLSQTRTHASHSLLIGTPTCNRSLQEPRLPARRTLVRGRCCMILFEKNAWAHKGCPENVDAWAYRSVIWCSWSTAR
jgi:hypothetical protein